MEKIKITCDSSADLNSLFEANGVGVIPLFVNLGEEEFFDGVTVTPDDIYKFVDEKGVLPKTAARSPEDLKDFFKQYTDEGYSVIHISISSKLSMVCHNARMAAKELENVYVIDGKSQSTGTGLLVLSAVDMVKQGLSAKEICEKLEKRAESVQASFVVNTMEYLHKGGRCSGVAAFAASALKIKPALLVENGSISVYKKYMSRTGSRAIRKYLEDIFEQFDTPDKTRVFITHTAIEQEVVDSVREVLKEKGFAEILETVAGSTITSHCGPGTLGVLYINDGE